MALYNIYSEGGGSGKLKWYIQHPNGASIGPFENFNEAAQKRVELRNEIVEEWANNVGRLVLQYRRRPLDTKTGRCTERQRHSVLDFRPSRVVTSAKERTLIGFNSVSETKLSKAEAEYFIRCYEFCKETSK